MDDAVPRVRRGDVVAERVPALLTLHPEMPIPVDAERVNRCVLEYLEDADGQVAKRGLLGWVRRIERQLLLNHLEREPASGKNRGVGRDDLDLCLVRLLPADQVVH